MLTTAIGIHSIGVGNAPSDLPAVEPLVPSALRMSKQASRMSQRYIAASANAVKDA